MVQQKRGLKFALSKIESLLEVVKAIISIVNPNWEKILKEHVSCYPTKDPLLCMMMGKAKKEEAMQELHHNNGGMEDVVMWIW
jgi:hypothetical protein